MLYADNEWWVALQRGDDPVTALEYLTEALRAARPAWHQRASCRLMGTDLDMWFRKSAADVELARSICADCPVRSECLQAAIDGNEKGTWGGLSEQERRRTS